MAESNISVENGDIFTNKTLNFILTINPHHNFFRHSNLISAMFVAAYMFVFALGVVGNTLVVAVVVKIRRMRTVTNFFIMSLAIADMLVIVICTPATLASNLVTPWILGPYLCKTVTFLQGLAVSASVNTLMAISIDRFLAICLPIRYQMTPHCCRCIIVTIWVYSAILASPWTVVFNLIFFAKTSDNKDLFVCREVWPTEQMGNAYFIVANLILCYLLPLFVIMVCYSFIWIKVWRRKTPGEGEHNNGMIQKSKVRVIKMLFTVVLVFMGSWLPLYAIFTRIKVGEPYQENSWEESVIQLLAPFAQWLGASNSCVNPVLYAFFNNRFRAGLISVLSLEKQCCRCTDTRQLTQVSAKSKIQTTSARTKNITSLKKCACETVAL